MLADSANIGEFRKIIRIQRKFANSVQFANSAYNSRIPLNWFFEQTNYCFFVDSTKCSEPRKFFVADSAKRNADSAK